MSDALSTIQSKIISLALPAGLLGLGIAIGYCFGSKFSRPDRFNKKIQCVQKKVKDIVFKDEIGEKKSFCRCWLSEKWPYCDGSHSKWNKLTGDNLGPVVVRERDMKVDI